jgi:tetratricopeptide (TPR) repeat protein
MTASPLPKPTGAPGGQDLPAPEPADADGWALLDTLRRKLDDQAAQQRKTCTQVTQLAESIAALVDTQRRRSRWLNLNSFVAYVMFTVLTSIAFYFVYAAHARELGSARDRAIAERDAAVHRADDATARLAQRDAADAAAARQGEAAARAAADEGARQDAVVQSALAAIKAGHYGEVAQPVERALANHPDPAHVARLHYLAGVARGKSGDFDAAIAHLSAAVDSDTVDEDARFQLASVLDRAGQRTEAKGEYDRFASAHPQSRFAAFAIWRSAQIARGAAAETPGGPGSGAPFAQPLAPAFWPTSAPTGALAPGAGAPAAPARER